MNERRKIIEDGNATRAIFENNLTSSVLQLEDNFLSIVTGLDGLMDILPFIIMFNRGKNTSNWVPPPLSEKGHFCSIVHHESALEIKNGFFPPNNIWMSAVFKESQ